MASEWSKILVFGGTGFLGKHIVKASIKMGHPTYLYARPITPNSTPSKTKLHREFHSMGVTIIKGELSDHEKLVWVIKQVDIVISVLGAPLLVEQLKIIDAIKAAGNVKRFIPSEFGLEDERISEVLPPFQAYLDKRNKIRKAIKAAAIPFTCLSSTCCAEYFLNLLLHPRDQSDVLKIFGTGQAKVVFTHEEDIGMHAIKAANDPRTLNRTVFYRPPKNVLSQLELVSMWEKKTGRIYNKIHVSEEDIVHISQTSAHPENARAAIIHSIFVRGDTASFELREEDMEVSKLYPDAEYATVDKILHSFVDNAPPFEFVEL